jgi:hypothetical protein
MIGVASYGKHLRIRLWFTIATSGNTLPVLTVVVHAD